MIKKFLSLATALSLGFSATSAMALDMSMRERAMMRRPTNADLMQRGKPKNPTAITHRLQGRVSRRVLKTQVLEKLNGRAAKFEIKRERAIPASSSSMSSSSMSSSSVSSTSSSSSSSSTSSSTSSSSSSTSSN